MAKSRLLGDEIATLEEERNAAESALERIMLEIPNVTLLDVPEGGEDNNLIVREWGDPRPAGGARPHWELGETLGLIDFPRGAKIAGSGFIVFRAGGARLVRAMMNFMLDLHGREHGYEEVWVPFVVNRPTMTGTGQLPKFEDDLYRLRDDDLFLVPTAEVPVTNLYSDELLAESRLPAGFVAYTPCFRREAGAHGKDTRGLLRVHEFDKVELVRYAIPEESPSELERLLGHAEAVVQRLGIPYRVKLLASGDTSFASAKTYDIEAWAPGVGKWLEISSCSNYSDFQARRANIRYRPADGGKPRFVHTLNGSALAFARTIACILEQYQRPDGTIEVPGPLRDYVGADSLG
jgi:seryl-tRNA synthetase